MSMLWTSRWKRSAAKEGKKLHRKEAGAMSINGIMAVDAWGAKP